MDTYRFDQNKVENGKEPTFRTSINKKLIPSVSATRTGQRSQGPFSEKNDASEVLLWH